MSAQAGWYPDPGGGQDLYRYWDGQAWSAATSPYPSAPPPARGLPGGTPAQPLGAQPQTGQGSTVLPDPSRGSGGRAAPGSAYAQYQQTQKQRPPVGWWLAGAALLLVIVVVAVIAVRSATGPGTTPFPNLPGGRASQDTCPQNELSPSVAPDPQDGRVHGGPLSMPRLAAPWSSPETEERVPFGSDAMTQTVVDQANYDGLGHAWVASVLVAELQAGDGFFSPEQGSAVVVRCILGRFYGDAPVTSDVTIDQATTIDGKQGWLVESQLSFDIPGLRTKGELLIVAVVSAGATSGLYYASIPDTRPELVAPARQALAGLQVDG